VIVASSSRRCQRNNFAKCFASLRLPGSAFIPALTGLLFILRRKSINWPNKPLTFQFCFKHYSETKEKNERPGKTANCWWKTRAQDFPWVLVIDRPFSGLQLIQLLSQRLEDVSGGGNYLCRGIRRLGVVLSSVCAESTIVIRLNLILNLKFSSWNVKFWVPF